MRWCLALALAVLIPRAVVADGGETTETAVVISSLPFQDAGDTCANLHDYDVTCPDPGSTAPDVVYVYWPDADVMVDMSLCDSGYDTKIYVWEDSQGNTVACNDDEGCGYGTWQSAIRDLQLLAGHAYYIVVDGYGTSCGSYRLDVVGQPPCIVECPQGSLQEGEPPCQQGYNDVYNSGCDGSGWTLIVAQDGGCSDMCGRTCVHFEDGVLVPDVDWYRMTAAGGPVSVVLESELPSLIEVGLASDCGSWGGGSTVVSPCEPASIGGPLPPGAEFWVKVSPYYVPATPEKTYHLHVCGIEGSPIPVLEGTWGQIKSRYRDATK